MIYSIRLPSGHEQLERYLSSMGWKVTPSGDLCGWIARHGQSLRSIEQDQVADPRNANWDREGMTFHFQDGKEALLFKLTWL